MRLPRREFLGLAAGSAAAAALPRAAWAADYPVRPVRIVEGFGGGGTPDLVVAADRAVAVAAIGPALHR